MTKKIEPKEIEFHLCHFGDGTGASSLVDEVKYARKYLTTLCNIMQAQNVPHTYYEDKVSKNRNANVNHLVKHHNADTNGFIVSVHLNASAGVTAQPIGFEVLYANPANKAIAQEICDKVCAVSGLKNRGAKLRRDIGVLTDTYEPAILIELGFVNSKADIAILDAKQKEICDAIAEVLAARIGHTVKRSTTHASAKAAASNKIGYSPSTSGGKIQDDNAFRLQSGKHTDLAAAQAAAEKLIAAGMMNYVTIVGFKE